VFPLRARDGGVLERVGQTEGSVDLARLAGLDPSGVICEIMNPDGTMARLPDLKKFGLEHHVRIVAVADVIKYRLRTERMVSRLAEGVIEVPGLGSFHTRLYRGIGSEGRHLVLWKGTLSAKPTLCRVQTAPPAWAAFGAGCSSLSRAMQGALAAIAEAGEGALVLMHLGPSAAAVEALFATDFGGKVETVPQAHAEALRDLGTGCQILTDLGLVELRLLSTSSRPVVGIEAYGLSIVERVADF
jgi:3,4-dihydroxy 2-butanone 4-phosphate synthase/GTP cyclohydrolase II